MTWLDLFAVMGEPGTLGFLGVLAWRVARLERAHNAKVGRLLSLEAQVDVHGRKLDTLTRWRERHHAP